MLSCYRERRFPAVVHRDFANALEKCGVTHVLLDIDGNEKLPHAFAAMLPEKAESQRANAVMAAFLLEI